MDDVIFGGTADRPARNLAEVALWLDNIRHDAPKPYDDYDEIEVVRRIERGEGSGYRVNGREVRARDVQLLFADAATGAQSPAIVSQGRIGAIISAKPGDRRALLEEAAGITGLHSRRHEAELRLKAAEANLLRLEDVLTTLATQLDGLKKQARQAARYRRLSDHIRRAEAVVLHLRWQAATAELAAAVERLHAAERAVADRTAAALAAERAREEAAAALPALRQSEAAASAELQRLMLARQALEEEERRIAAARHAAEQRLGAARRRHRARGRAWPPTRAPRSSGSTAESAELVAAQAQEERARGAGRGRARAPRAPRSARSRAELTRLTDEIAADRGAAHRARSHAVQEAGERAQRLAEREADAGTRSAPRSTPRASPPSAPPPPREAVRAAEAEVDGQPRRRRRRRQQELRAAEGGGDGSARAARSGRAQPRQAARRGAGAFRAARRGERPALHADPRRHPGRAGLRGGARRGPGRRSHRAARCQRRRCIGTTSPITTRRCRFPTVPRRWRRR